MWVAAATQVVVWGMAVLLGLPGWVDAEAEERRKTRGVRPAASPRARPLVSVVMPFLNCERFIAEAIESVLSQTHDPWELLLVDDGSTDLSTGIARRYAAQYPDRIRILEHSGQAHRGASASRNLGVREAAGRYLAFLDADDVWPPRALQSYVAELEGRPTVAMVYGPAVVWRSWPSAPQDAGRDSVQQLGVQTNRLYDPPTLLPHFLRNDGFTPCTGSVLIRREVVDRVGGFEDEFSGAYDDQVLFAKVCLEESVFVYDSPCLKYRRHAASICSMMFTKGEYHARRSCFLGWLEKYLQSQGCTDGEVWVALRRQLWRYRHPRLHRLSELVERFGRTLTVGGSWRGAHRAG